MKSTKLLVHNLPPALYTPYIGFFLPILLLESKENTTIAYLPCTRPENLFN